MNVTALNIGPESNIPLNTPLIIKDQPESAMTAKNTQALTGGTSREVSSVSKNDEDNLVSQLTDELITRAKAEMTLHLNPGEKLIDLLTKSEVVQKKSNPPVGSEAKETTLTLSLKITAYSYKEDDLQTLSQQIVVSPPPGFSSDQNQTSVIIDKAELDKTGVIKAKGKISAYFLPNIDLTGIQNKLTSQTKDQVVEYLRTVPFVGGVRMYNDSPFFFLRDRMPFIKNNITVKILPTIL